MWTSNHLTWTLTEVVIHQCRSSQLKTRVQDSPLRAGFFEILKVFHNKHMQIRERIDDNKYSVQNSEKGLQPISN